MAKQKLDQQSSLIADAAQTLHEASKIIGKPILIPMLPPGNELNLPPGQIAPGRSELLPSCDGVVFGVACSAEEAQELLDLVTRWQQNVLARRLLRGDRP